MVELAPWALHTWPVSGSTQGVGAHFFVVLVRAGLGAGPSRQGGYSAAPPFGPVLTTAYRLTALDEPRIAEGLRLTRQIIIQLQRLVERQGVRAAATPLLTKGGVHIPPFPAQTGA